MITAPGLEHHHLSSTSPNQSSHLSIIHQQLLAIEHHRLNNTSRIPYPLPLELDQDMIIVTYNASFFASSYQGAFGVCAVDTQGRVCARMAQKISSTMVECLAVEAALLLIHAKQWKSGLLFGDSGALHSILHSSVDDGDSNIDWMWKPIDTNEKKMTLIVQSLRNTLMGTILAATIAVLLNSCLAALANNAYNASYLLKDSFGAQTSWTISLKYASISLPLLVSFTSSSLALGWLNEAHFMANASEFSQGYIQDLMDRGIAFSFIGLRMLYVTVPLFLWLFGPVPMVLSSVAMVWVLYGIDFTNEVHNHGRIAQLL